jgi:hypothetical protein
MASGQENSESNERTLVIKFLKGSSLDERVQDYRGDEDVSGAAFVLRAVEALLTASGRPAPEEKK